MRLFYIIVTLLALSGCTTKVPNITEYRISSNLLPENFQEQACSDKSLKVHQAFSSDTLMSKKMSYVQGKYQQDVFTQSQWAQTPHRAITQELVKFIQETKLFKNIQTSKSRSRSGMVLETNIEEFMQHFSEDGKNSFVKLRITFTLLDNKQVKLVESQTFKSKVRVDSLNAEGGVIALNTALENTLNEMGLWLGRFCI